MLCSMAHRVICLLLSIYPEMTDREMIAIDVVIPQYPHEYPDLPMNLRLSPTKIKGSNVVPTHHYALVACTRKLRQGHRFDENGVPCLKRDEQGMINSEDFLAVTRL